MDNGKFEQAIEPAAWARRLAPDDYSIKVHLELTMLLALGLLDEKPSWMDEHPVIRSDGVAWSRYWWPRPMENRELLAAAALPREVLERILPTHAPAGEAGDLADALYGRAGHYADKACVARVREAAIHQSSAAEGAYLNAVRLARQRAMLEAIGKPSPQPNQPDAFLRPPIPFAPTPFPAMLHPPAAAHALTSMSHQPDGARHAQVGMNAQQLGFPACGLREFAQSHATLSASDQHFAAAHGIWRNSPSGSLFEYMGQPEQLPHDETQGRLPQSQGDE